MSTNKCGWGLWVVLLCACGSEPPNSDVDDEMTSPDEQPAMHDSSPLPPAEQPRSDHPPPPYKATTEPGGVTIPLDQREATSAATPPPPISGGTLLVTRDGAYAIAADPDRDRVSIVDLAGSGSLRANVALEPGDEPGRLTEDDAGRVHVALRRAGMVASIDVASGTLLARRPVCAAPRGIAFDAGSHSLLIACTNGALMQLPADPDFGDAVMRQQLARDLRDVLVDGDRTFVSRFKRAEVLEVPADGSAPAVDVPETIGNGGTLSQQFVPEIAWRFTRASDGSTYLLHQGARGDTIELDPPDASESPIPPPGPYGGGSIQCSGVVQSEITMFPGDGTQQVSERMPGVLPIDFALNERNAEIAVVFAGTADSNAPPRTTPPFTGSGVAGPAFDAPADPGVEFPGSPSSLSVMIFSTKSWNRASTVPDSCIAPIAGLMSGVAFEPTAIAVAGDAYAVQTREPANLVLINPGGAVSIIDLEGDSVADTGHTLFHHDAGGGVACASCHAEGGEDGHVWQFSDSGERRTQALNVGLAGTAPFHWAGDMPGIPELMEEVLVHRMGGVHETMGRTEALEQWLFSLQPPAPLRDIDDPAAVRGSKLFTGRAECSSCHSGDKLTNNSNYDVGTGGSFQVPSLIGVSSRGPWLHTGCARTLRDRFDPRCGGDQHGKTADLSDAQIDDLIAYLESL